MPLLRAVILILTAGFACRAGLVSTMPTCLDEWCMTGELTTEREVRKSLGTATRKDGFRSFQYCYEFVVQGHPSAYVRFDFTQRDGAWRLTTLDAAAVPLCTPAVRVTRSRPIETAEGIGLDSPASEVQSRYAERPAFVGPVSRDLARDFFGLEHAVKIDSQLLYNGPKDALLSGRFFVSDGRVIGISLSADE